MHQPNTRTENGFTLVELLIAMVIALVVITSLASAFIYQRKTYDVQEQVTEMTQNARAAMDMMSREIKMAGYNPTGTLTLGTSVGIIYDESLDPAELHLLADLDGDGTTSGSNESIIYTYDSTNKEINRNTGGGAQPFAENIDDFSFLFYDEDGGTTTTSSEIREVEVTIEAKTSKQDPNYTHPDHSDGYRRYELKSYVTPPNLAL